MKEYDVILDIMKLARDHRSILSDSNKKLTPSGTAVLIALSEKDGVSATDIANSMGYEKPFVTHVLKGLIAEDYVTVNRIDGRTINITITNKGRETATEAKENLNKYVEVLFQNCSESERYTFRNNIRKMTAIKFN